MIDKCNLTLIPDLQWIKNRVMYFYTASIQCLALWVGHQESHAA